ncbi:MAG: hypothetical protein A3G81_16850 [Betaproteobacteria bacterium RIFCSPLOWO2_12_FULL_65_14]|nr:MAG: hypothetical protein A3G81_16850 [Betaproteobacteria bacterium RIFCSPLOWO2_12_FULL_65_14]
MRFVIHIGNGKTGTSAVQRFLGDNREALRSKGVLYAGLAFEHCKLPDMSWSAVVKGAAFLSRPAPQIAAPLTSVLGQLVTQCEEKGFHSAIWSNESLFVVPDKVATALNGIADRAEIVLVAYIRRQDRWAVSAYKQWGIKHKTYTGPVQPFDKWFNPARCSYVPILDRWRKLVPSAKLVVRVYERCANDVISDFARASGLSLEGLEMPKGRVYETPADAALALYKIYNSQFPGNKLPTDLDGLLKSAGVAQASLAPVDLDLGFPSRADLERLLERYQGENERLSRFSSPDYEVRFDDEDVEAPRRDPVDQSALIAALLMISVDLDKRLRAMSRKLERLSKETHSA